MVAALSNRLRQASQAIGDVAPARARVVQRYEPGYRSIASSPETPAVAMRYDYQNLPTVPYKTTEFQNLSIDTVGAAPAQGTRVPAMRGEEAADVGGYTMGLSGQPVARDLPRALVTEEMRRTAPATAARLDEVNRQLLADEKWVSPLRGGAVRTGDLTYGPETIDDIVALERQANLDAIAYRPSAYPGEKIRGEVYQEDLPEVVQYGKQKSKFRPRKWETTVDTTAGPKEYFDINAERNNIDPLLAPQVATGRSRAMQQPIQKEYLRPQSETLGETIRTDTGDFQYTDEFYLNPRVGQFVADHRSIDAPTLDRLRGLPSRPAQLATTTNLSRLQSGNFDDTPITRYAYPPDVARGYSDVAEFTNSLPTVSADTLQSRLRRTGQFTDDQIVDITGQPIANPVPYVAGDGPTGVTQLQRRNTALFLNDSRARQQVAIDNEFLAPSNAPRTNYIVREQPTRDLNMFSQTPAYTDDDAADALIPKSISRTLPDGTIQTQTLPTKEIKYTVPDAAADEVVHAPLALDNLVTSTYTNTAPTPIVLKAGNVGLDQRIGRSTPNSRAYIATKSIDPEMIGDRAAYIDPNLPAGTITRPRYVAIDPTAPIDLTDQTYQNFGVGLGLDIEHTPEQVIDDYVRLAGDRYSPNPSERRGLYQSLIINKETRRPGMTLAEFKRNKNDAKVIRSLAKKLRRETTNIKQAMNVVNAQSTPQPTESIFKRIVGPRGGQEQIRDVGEQPFPFIAKAVAGSGKRPEGIVEEVLTIPRVPAQDLSGQDLGQRTREMYISGEGKNRRLRAQPDSTNPRIARDQPRVKVNEVGTGADVTILSELNNTIGKQIKALDPNAFEGQLRRGVRYVELPDDSGRSLGSKVKVLDPGQPVLDSYGKPMQWDGQPINTTPVTPDSRMEPTLSARLRNSNHQVNRDRAIADIRAAQEEGYMVGSKGRLDAGNIPLSTDDIAEIRQGVPEQVLRENYVPEPMRDDQRRAINRLSARSLYGDRGVDPAASQLRDAARRQAGYRPRSLSGQTRYDMGNFPSTPSPYA